VSASPEYGEVLAHLREARAALSRAESALDLIGPGDLQPGALDDLVVGIQTSADLIGRRTGTNGRERAAQGEDAGRLGMLAPDAVATYAAMLEATEPDSGRRAELHGELARLTAERQGWDETARACACPPGQCTRGEFTDHQGDGVSPGCMVCADLDPDQPCYAAVLARLEAGQ
jgi:hypothetical protein